MIQICSLNKFSSFYFIST